VVIEKLKEVPKYIYVTDTIYQEVKSEPIVITKEVIKIVEVEVPIIQESEPVYVAGSQKELGLIPIDEAELVDLLKSGNEEQEGLNESLGQSISEDGALLEFLDGMN